MHGIRDSPTSPATIKVTLQLNQLRCFGIIVQLHRTTLKEMNSFNIQTFVSDNQKIIYKTK